ncbi:hypothetical protein K1719_035229 [Acacia pycnantha]|nr:hypothetical protein K1719_035229 [Acacia pycnantha]
MEDYSSGGQQAKTSSWYSNNMNYIEDLMMQASFSVGDADDLIAVSLASMKMEDSVTAGTLNEKKKQQFHVLQTKDELIRVKQELEATRQQVNQQTEMMKQMQEQLPSLLKDK